MDVITNLEAELVGYLQSDAYRAAQRDYPDAKLGRIEQSGLVWALASDDDLRGLRMLSAGCAVTEAVAEIHNGELHRAADLLALAMVSADRAGETIEQWDQDVAYAVGELRKSADWEAIAEMYPELTVI